MNRRGWRFAGGDHRAGQAMPVRRIDLRSAQGRIVKAAAAVTNAEGSTENA